VLERELKQNMGRRRLRRTMTCAETRTTQRSTETFLDVGRPEVEVDLEEVGSEQNQGRRKRSEKKVAAGMGRKGTRFAG
jgi:hypothetical protein